MVAHGRVCLTLLMAWPGWAGAIDVPGQPPFEKVDFERHVMGVLSKAGCNGGSCHGSFQGKNGFRLSLFGYDADKDFACITKEHFGRRIDVIEPESSLLLLKATGRMPHEGGVRFGANSWEYKVLKEWLAAGAPWNKGSGTVDALQLDVADFALVPRGQSKQLNVTARFADGSKEEVSAFCEFKISDDTVAEVTPHGLLTARQPGDAGLVVSYRGVIRGVRVLVPSSLSEGTSFPKIETHNFIDREVAAKLQMLNMIPAELASDAEFLRRVTIDTIGTLSTPDEVRNFLADKSADKRAKKIDELLAQPLHGAVWATRFSDITGNNTEALAGIPPGLRAKYSQMWHDWFRKRINDNMPYDQIVRGVLTATSRGDLDAKEWVNQQVKYDEQAEKGFDSDYPQRDSLDLFWKQQNLNLEARGEKIAAAFLGVRLECAQCHKHPTDRWTQNDYRGFANVFHQVQIGASPETRKLVNEVNQQRKDATPKNKQATQLREVFLSATPAPNRGRPGKGIVNGSALKNPDTNEPVTPKALGGPELVVEKPRQDCREGLFNWLTEPGNPYFARAFVNRVWAHYLGVGIVVPVDDFSVANPPTNPRLLDALAKEFIEHKFDVRHIERVILSSRTYQQSSVANASNKFDRNSFARAYLRPMLAETVVDVLNAALGVKEDFRNDAPSGANMIEVGSSRLNNPNLNYVLRIFGRPPRTSARDCERVNDPALPQTLYRMTDPGVLQKLTAKNGRLAELLTQKVTDDKAFEELMLATLSRLPTDKERQAFMKYRAGETNRTAALQDALWALINTREFILNH